MSEHIDYFHNQAAAWTDIFDTFKYNQTPNGPGSTIEFTEPLRQWLPGILKQYDVYTILDAPCGDLNWISLVDLSECEYTGWDIEPNILERNRLRYPLHQFDQVNLLMLDEGMPQVDLVICRDFLIHLANEDAMLVLKRIRQSGSRLLLTTNMPYASNDGCDRTDLGVGHDERPGYWHRPINLEKEPFCMIGRVAEVTEHDGREMVLYEL